MPRLQFLLSLIFFAQPLYAQMPKPMPSQDTANIYARKSLHAGRRWVNVFHAGSAVGPKSTASGSGILSVTLLSLRICIR